MSSESQNTPDTVTPYSGTWDRGNPYPGARPYSVYESAVFFGRAAAMEAAEAIFRRNAEAGKAFLLVSGVSGVGKTSFVRAGLVPALARSSAAEGVGIFRFADLQVMPGEEKLFVRLAEALCREDALPELLLDGTPLQSLAEMLRENPKSAGILLKSALSLAAREKEFRDKLERPPKTRLVLFIDPVEAIFQGRGASTEDRASFFTALHALAKSGLVWVVSSLRSDQTNVVSQDTEFAGLRENLEQFQLMPPSQADIGRIIRQPVLATGAEYEEDEQSGLRLDALIREPASQNPSCLPLLASYLSKLYDAGLADGKVRFAGYRKLGTFTDFMVAEAESAFDRLPEDSQAAFSKAIGLLVSMTLGESSTLVRRFAPIAEIAETPAAKLLVEQLIERRILVAGANAHFLPGVMIAHDALLLEWSRLRDYLEGERAFLMARARLDVEEARWREMDQSEDYLLVAPGPIRDAETLLAQRSGHLTRSEADFLKLSIQRREELVGRRDKVGRKWIFYTLAASAASVLLALLFLGSLANAQIKVAAAENDADDRVEEAERETEAVRAEVDEAKEEVRQVEQQREAAEKLVGSVVANVYREADEPGDLDVLEPAADAGLDYLTTVAPSEPENREAIKTRAVTMGALGEVLLKKREDPRALKAIERSLQLLESLPPSELTAPPARFDLGSLTIAKGRTLLSRGSLDEGIAAYRRGLSLMREAVQGDSSRLAWARRLSSEYRRLGQTLAETGQIGESRQLFEESLVIMRDLATRPSSALTPAQVVADARASADVLENQFRGDDAAALLKSNLLWMRETAGKAPDNQALQVLLGDALGDLARVYLRTGQVELARDIAEEQLETLRAVKDATEDRPNLTEDVASVNGRIGEAYTTLAVAICGTGACDEALDSVIKGQEFAKFQLANSPWEKRWHVALGRALIAEADILIQMADIAGARNAVDQAIKALERIARKDPMDADILKAQGEARFIEGFLWLAGDPLKAADAANASIRAFERVSSFSGRSRLGSRALADAYGLLADALLEGAGTRDAAREALRSRLDLIDGLPVGFVSRRDLADVTGELAQLTAEAGEQEEALALLERRIEQLAKLADLAAGTPEERERRVELASTYQRAGSVLKSLGRTTQAEDYFARQVSILEATLGLGDRQNASPRELAELFRTLGETFASQQKPDEALQYLGQAISALQTIPENELTVDDRAALARIYQEVGNTWFDANDLDQAELAYNDGLLAIDSDDQDSLPRDQKLLIAQMKGRLGEVLQMRGSFDLAMPFIDQALEITKPIYEENPADDAVAKAHARLLNLAGNGHLSGNEAALALSFFDRAAMIAEVGLENASSDADWVRTTADVYLNYGGYHASRENHLEATAYFAEAVDMLQGLVDEDPDNETLVHSLAAANLSYGESLSANGEPDKALATLGRGIKLSEALARKTPADPRPARNLSLSYQAMGRIYRDEGNTDDALASFQKAGQIGETLATEFKANPGWIIFLANIWNDIAAIYQERGQTEAAIREYTASLAYLRNLNERHPDLANWRVDMANVSARIGELHLARRNFDPAIAALEQALTWAGELASEDPANFELLNGHYLANQRLAEAYVAKGSLQRSLDYFRAGVGILEEMRRQRPGDFDTEWNLAGALNQVGIVYLDTRQPRQARDFLEQGAGILETLAGRFPRRPQIRIDLAGTYLNLLASYAEGGSPRGSDFSETLRKTGNLLEGLKSEVGLTPRERSALRDLVDGYRQFERDV